MDPNQFGKRTVGLNVGLDESFVVKPRRYSWQEVVDCNQQEQILNTDMARNAISALDIIIAILNEEVRRVRQYIPKVSIAELLNLAKTKVPKFKLQSFIEFIRWFTGTPNRMLQGNEVNIDAALVKLDSSEDFSNSFSDDDDESMHAASTVCSLANDKKINELEAQLNELKQTLKLIMDQKGVTPPTPEVAKSKPGVIPPVSKVAPPPPPPPPFLLKKKSSPVATVIPTQLSSPEESVDENNPPVPVPRIGLNFLELGSVKLKKVARTPGGTPIRHLSQSQDREDIAGCLAKALKQKFRNTGETEENCNDDLNSDDDWGEEETQGLKS
ncbi:unnamed protein product [Bursaphelenchus xylophilus]|uniref:(pine wood nematode) hypothetical protein n=1 Tax=Bursaphelenchus xylophilus TaxID=6326 RepID=A0A1I7S3R0_BURXY|nr:unnamed protein product [Bursaphelenchus xylophilus]CAG9116473.1 unnamed protein product [Bursaphelenchus xylophilus]